MSASYSFLSHHATSSFVSHEYEEGNIESSSYEEHSLRDITPSSSSVSISEYRLSSMGRERDLLGERSERRRV